MPSPRSRWTRPPAADPRASGCCRRSTGAARSSPRVPRAAAPWTPPGASGGQPARAERPIHERADGRVDPRVLEELLGECLPERIAARLEQVVADEERRPPAVARTLERLAHGGLDQLAGG